MGGRTKTPKGVRLSVWNRYIGKDRIKGKCYVCKEPIRITDFEDGHNKAVSKGGSNRITNLRPICRKCNLSMRTMSIEIYKTEYYPKTKTGQSYSCKLPTNSRWVPCNKKKADKSCLRRNWIDGKKCQYLIISRK